MVCMDMESTAAANGQHDRTDEPARARAVPRVDIEALNRQRIRFNGFFSGPTW
jgi:hypothetical protein